MESTEFDSTLGGSEHLPHSARSLKFAASRSVEIAAMTESIMRPSKTNLIFQTLPVHMRRRVMSHNCKRLPRRLREGHLEQLRKSGLPPKQKRPSRKYRRRPGNLLEEYNRRQKRHIWLETHIWHAKRFHMCERWRHRLALAPCDKAFRACYRASSAHCLLQDISYYTPIQITGTIDKIRDMFNNLTNSAMGLGVCAKAYTSGNREGEVHLYNPNTFPFNYIGKVHFMWVDNGSSTKTLMLFVHPSQSEQINLVLTDLLNSELKCETVIPEKRRKITHSSADNVQIKLLDTSFNRFRLTGPNSHSVLVHSLKCVSDIATIKTNDWISILPDKSELYLKEKHEYWESVRLVSSPSQLPPRSVIGLIIRDPRLSRPSHRTKAQQKNNTVLNVESLVKLPQKVSTSPLWYTQIHESIKNKRLTNAEFIQHVTKNQLVPGELYEEDPALQSIPVVLVQRPGSQDPNFKKVGYGSGWDIIVPSGYGMPFWLTFIMFGARAGGLRESESLAFEMGECYLPPDSDAGKEKAKRMEAELRDKYFKLPPSKRVNYAKLAINSPFCNPWKLLLSDWHDSPVTDYFVIRDKKGLDNLQNCITQKKHIPQIENASNCLVAVYLQIAGKGNLKRHALICLPQPGDISDGKTLLEPHHDDPNEKQRKQKRVEHKKNIKQWRRKRTKLKKKGAKINTIKSKKREKHEPSEYVKSMRELWLPSDIQTVRHAATRQVLGYLSQGAFSFSEAQSCGVGYVAYNALSMLLKMGLNQVLLRNTTSRTYRIANLKIVKTT